LEKCFHTQNTNNMLICHSDECKKQKKVKNVVSNTMLKHCTTTYKANKKLYIDSKPYYSFPGSLKV